MLMLRKLLQHNPRRHMVELWSKDSQAIHIVPQPIHGRVQRNNPASATAAVSKHDRLLDAVDLLVANLLHGLEQRHEARLGQAAVDRLVGLAHRGLVARVGGGDFPSCEVEPVEAAAMICLGAFGVSVSQSVQSVPPKKGGRL